MTEAQAREQPDFLGNAQASGFVLPRYIPKPWGHEEWIVVTDKYVMKRLVVRKGESLSKQYHRQKMETLVVAKGSCWLLLGQEGDLTLENAQKHLFREGEAVTVATHSRYS